MWADLQEAAAQAQGLVGDAAAVEVRPEHANDRAPLLVADGIEEGLNPAGGIHTCASTSVLCHWFFSCRPQV